MGGFTPCPHNVVSRILGDPVVIVAVPGRSDPAAPRCVQHPHHHGKPTPTPAVTCTCVFEAAWPSRVALHVVVGWSAWCLRMGPGVQCGGGGGGGSGVCVCVWGGGRHQQPRNRVVPEEGRHQHHRHFGCCGSVARSNLVAGYRLVTVWLPSGGSGSPTRCDARAQVTSMSPEAARALPAHQAAMVLEPRGDHAYASSTFRYAVNTGHDGDLSRNWQVRNTCCADPSVRLTRTHTHTRSRTCTHACTRCGPGPFACTLVLRKLRAHAAVGHGPSVHLTRTDVADAGAGSCCPRPSTRRLGLASRCSSTWARRRCTTTTRRATTTRLGAVQSPPAPCGPSRCWPGHGRSASSLPWRPPRSVHRDDMPPCGRRLRLRCLWWLRWLPWP